MRNCLCVFLFLTIQFMSWTNSTPLPSFVATSTEPSKEISKENEKEAVPNVPKIYEMKIFSNVSNRFAHTAITSKVKNLGDKAQEATFSVILPEHAFISGFVMEIGGKSYTAYVKEKEEAKQVYDQAVASGTGAAHVAASARDSNRFVVSTNVEPQSKAVFHLYYEELLQRSNGHYDIVINIHPGQPVKNLDVEVHINESRPLKFVKTTPIRSGNEITKEKEELNPHADIETINATSAVVKFAPDVERQKELAKELGKDSKEGLAGQFVVQYDVERDPYGGEVLVNDGYFVHFFAPTNLKPLPKQVIFVLDTSGSMYDRKLEQLKEAMKSIMGELKENDFFNFVEFNTNVKIWNLDNNNDSIHYPNQEDNWYSLESNVPLNNLTFPPAYAANSDNKEKANKVIDQLDANGGTNIFEALKVALHLVKLMKEDKEKSPQPLIVFLTDGDPTVGLTNPDKIIDRVSELNSGDGKSPIFSLSFGTGADKNFLQRLSLRNLGFSRHIYEAADASLQLQNFYKKISSPLLSNVKFNYATGIVSNVTKSRFPIFFDGSEIAVAGVIENKFDELPIIQCFGEGGPIDFVPEKVETPVYDLERLWAYLTVKQLIDARDAATDKTAYEKEALALALKYSFVTPVSSLVVVKPNATNSSVNTEAADTEHKNYLVPVPIASFAANSGRRYFMPMYSSTNFMRFGGGGGSSYGGAAGVPLMLPRPAAFYPTTFDIASTANAPSILPEGTHQMVAQKIDVEEESVVDGLMVTTEATTVASLDEIEELKQKLPWLQDILKDNNTVTTPAGDLKLGLGETITTIPDCSNASNNSTGHCVLLTECTNTFTLLTSVDLFNQHFCAINNEYAGICCQTPKKPVS